MLEIQLSDEAARLALVQSTAAGFGDKVGDYVEQLIVLNPMVAVGPVPSPRSEEELTQMVQEGFDSPDAPLPWDEYMALLETQISARASRENK